MELRTIDTAEELNIFVGRVRHSTFLQSYEWGEFQKSLGRTVWRVGVYDDEVLCAAATVIAYPLPLGLSYLYVPYGPVFADECSRKQQEDIIKILLTKLRSITAATKQRYEVFSRIEPRVLWQDVGNFLINTGLKKTEAVQPQDTEIVSLERDEADLRARMHSKTRYNIRLAQKKGVTVREAASAEDLETFWQLLELTTKRDNFNAHPKSYYEKLYEQFGHTDIDNQLLLTIKIYIAEYSGTAIGAIMVGFFGQKALYLHGAFDHEHRQVMAPQLMQWHAMTYAKAHGYTSYDFWGIKPANRHLPSSSKEQAWEGITRFKKGFGGDEVNYAGAWDYVYDKKVYALYRIAKRIL